MRGPDHGQQGNKLLAIRWVRDHAGAGLREARDDVEAVGAGTMR